MTTLNRTPALFGWIFSHMTLLLKPRYTAREMVAVVGGSGNPVGA